MERYTTVTRRSLPLCDAGRRGWTNSAELIPCNESCRLESYTAEPRHTNPTELAYPRRASPRKDEFNLFDLGPHTCRAYDSVRYWVRRVAEIQRGLSLANCLIDVAVRRRSEWPKKGEPMKGRLRDTDRAISIGFPISLFSVSLLLFQRGQTTLLTPIASTHLIRAEVSR